MCGHPCDQVIMNIHAVRLGLTGFDDQAGAALCAHEAAGMDGSWVGGVIIPGRAGMVIL
jgi:hypothetical protein